MVWYNPISWFRGKYSEPDKTPEQVRADEGHSELKEAIEERRRLLQFGNMGRSACLECRGCEWRTSNAPFDHRGI